jgi:hypothetical protein
MCGVRRHAEACEASGNRRAIPPGRAEVDDPVQNRCGPGGRFDLKPDGFGEDFEAEVEEGAARLLPSGEVCRGEQGITAIFESQPSRVFAPSDLKHSTIHELPPFVDPSPGLLVSEGAGNRNAGHGKRLSTATRISSPSRRMHPVSTCIS